VPECLYYYRIIVRRYRLTTHLPLSVHSREVARILRKHGVGWWTVARSVLRARGGYLRQCLYRNGLDKCSRSGIGFDLHTAAGDSHTLRATQRGDALRQAKPQPAERADWRPMEGAAAPGGSLCGRKRVVRRTGDGGVCGESSPSPPLTPPSA